MSERSNRLKDLLVEISCVNWRDFEKNVSLAISRLAREDDTLDYYFADFEYTLSEALYFLKNGYVYYVPTLRYDFLFKWLNDENLEENFITFAKKYIPKYASFIEDVWENRYYHKEVMHAYCKIKDIVLDCEVMINTEAINILTEKLEEKLSGDVKIVYEFFRDWEDFQRYGHYEIKLVKTTKL